MGKKTKSSSGNNSIAEKEKENAEKEKAIASKLIGMNAPSWFDKIQVGLLRKNWALWQSGFMNSNSFKKKIAKLFQIDESKISVGTSPVPSKGSVVRLELSSKHLYDMYIAERMFSTPESGQDPKMYSVDNMKIAGQHAARHWGRIRHQSDWINGLTINTVMADDKIILEIVNGEHRLWGIIGFQLGVVPLISPDGKDLYFYSDKLAGTVKSRGIDGKILVNNLKLSEIVDKANSNLANKANRVTVDDVLSVFNTNTIKVTLLPMYNRDQASFYFEEENSSSNKKLPALFHARTEYANIQIRRYSSIKDHLFVGSDDEMHPFFIDCVSEKEQYNLMPHMMSHMITQRIIKKEFLPRPKTDNGTFVKSTDGNLLEEYEKMSGYKDYYTEDEILEGKTKNCLTYLHSLCSNASSKFEPSKQEMQYLAEMEDYLGERNCYICDSGTLIDLFLEFKHKNYFLIPGDSSSGKTAFGQHMSHSGLKDYERGWKFIRKNFLGNGKSHTSFKEDEDRLEMGIATWGEELPRKFSTHRTNRSAREHGYKDIDGRSFIELGITPAGGHIISHWELRHLSDSERDQAAVREGFKSGKFVFEENCRAISPYHNQRMGVLPLSLYLPIMNESDEIVREREREFKEQILNRHKNYRRAA